MAVLQPLLIKQIEISDSFWKPRQEVVRKVTIPYGFKICRQTGCFDLFNGKWLKKEWPKPYTDSDVGKWIEAAAYCLQAKTDKKLEAYLDRLINTIVGIQGKDGYLNTYYTVIEPGKRWTNLRDNHELYNAGHLMEGAVAYFEATGKRKLLDAVCRFADYIDSVFGRAKGKKCGYPGHEEIELALVKLYRATGNRKYMRLSKYFVDERGTKPYFFIQEAIQRGENPKRHKRRPRYDYTQSHVPVRKQTTAEGHAVRAMYLYCSMADIAAETNDRKLLQACRRIWENVTQRRMYVTGGVGSGAKGERFTTDYDLPNETAYAETCAAIGLVLWAHRMLQIERKAEYADIMERALYNGILSGLSLSGDRFFYRNPLAALSISVPTDGIPAERYGSQRRPWFSTACCPPNIARMLASLGKYIYSQVGSHMFVHLFVQGKSRFQIGRANVELILKTEYPWDENVALTIQTERLVKFGLNVRIPGWCKSPSLAVNGKRVDLAVVMRSGYAWIHRLWKNGDQVRLVLPMPVERVRAHPKVQANVGRVALQRGPLVYCLEQTDNGTDLDALALPKKSQLVVKRFGKLYPGAMAIEGLALRTASGNRDDLYRTDAQQSRKVRFRAVPYFLWANRKPGEMMVWVQEGR